METKIIDGRVLSDQLRKSIKQKVCELRQNNIIPGLTVILVGDDPASQIYVRNKKRACEQVGINSNVIRLDNNITEYELLGKIHDLNEDTSVHGILVQLPLPSHLSSEKIINTIDPSKDVDGFHPVNAGKLLAGQPYLAPCTPRGIIKLIESTGEDISGKHAVVIGRSNIVGKPVSIMLLQKNATVTICHSKTIELDKIARQGDILVVAMGRPQSITDKYIKTGAIVIDVGTSRVNGKLLGDVVFEDAKGKAGWITPVPGGVGPMTITMLLENTILAAQSSSVL
ncbi:MAG: bifunctional methylenetetrahydrofolate dehydrogenase/methenyltetrahydrofolate cyclohydrolase FolD [Xylanivirga thermophila]|uniref:bifunctional methylenetetrahydrofolate dehydrogenase/methenyltetrahydrofolate cyclohydrolase FolD n=1 Tax=Xylanivirga thermophila TaxID=2496273 RepID=UPI0039F53780